MPAVVEYLTESPVTLAELLREAGEVQLAPGTTTAGRKLAASLSAGSTLEVLDRQLWREAGERFVAFSARLDDLGIPKGGELVMAERRATDADAKAARQLGEPLAVLLGLSLDRWGMTLADTATNFSAIPAA